MKFYEAISLDLEAFINLDSAIQAFEDGVLVDPHRFECPDRSCQAPLTLRALPELEDGGPRKREPHFATRGRKELHNIEACEYYLNDIKKGSYKRRHPTYEDDLKNPDLDDVFDSKRRTFVHPIQDGDRQNRPAILAVKTNRENLTHFSLIASIASRFERMPATFAKRKHLRIGGLRLPYSEIFVNPELIGEKNLVGRYKRIYYGNAILKEVKNKAGIKLGYGFYFTDSIPINDQLYRGSCTIWDTARSEYAGAKRLTRWIDDILADRQTKLVKVYVYASCITNKEGNQNNNLFLNLSPVNLDHIYFYSLG